MYFSEPTKFIMFLPRRPELPLSFPELADPQLILSTASGQLFRSVLHAQIADAFSKKGGNLMTS
jgi:hypothetical protein